MSTKAMRAYKDWRTLHAEGVTDKISDIAQFITDNTDDPRSNGSSPGLVVTGYYAEVQQWIERTFRA